MLLSCCLIHITIIIVRHILYLVYLHPCLSLCLFMSYLCHLFFIFSLIFIVIEYITSFKQTYLFFIHFLENALLFLGDNVDEEREQFWNSKTSASRCCLAFACFANFSMTLVMKVLLIKSLYQVFLVINYFTLWQIIPLDIPLTSNNVPLMPNNVPLTSNKLIKRDKYQLHCEQKSRLSNASKCFVSSSLKYFRDTKMNISSNETFQNLMLKPNLWDLASKMLLCCI